MAAEDRPARRELPRFPPAEQTARCRPQGPRHERNISFSFMAATRRFRDLTLTDSAQPDHPRRRTFVELDNVGARAQKIAERLEAQRLFAERRAHPLHL